jgi:hypothetical protein
MALVLAGTRTADAYSPFYEPPEEGTVEVEAMVFDPEVDGWSDVLTVRVEADGYEGQLVDAVEALMADYDVPLGTIRSTEAVGDLSAFSPWSFEPDAEWTGNEQDELDGPGVAVEIRDGGKLVVVLLKGLKA